MSFFAVFGYVCCFGVFFLLESFLQKLADRKAQTK